jgi:hypothetical protein
MADRRWFKSLAASLALITAIALAPAMASAAGGPGGPPGQRGRVGPGGPAALGGALVQCSAVKAPGSLSGCGSDPLSQGMATIDNVGNVDVEVSGAAASQTYGVVFRSPNGGSSTTIGNLTTDSNGDGSLREKTFFAYGNVGAGILVLTRSGDEYVTGFAVRASSTPLSSSSAGPGGPGLETGLVTCGSVGVPAALTGCGTDALSRGNVDIEGDGNLAILISGAAASQTYTAALRSPTGAQSALGSLTTNSKGAGTLTKTGAFAAGTTGSGTVVLQRLGDDQFLSGFYVNQKPISPVVSEANLITCAAVVASNSALTSVETCGTDPLTQGSAQVNASGQLSVRLTGALPSTSYQVFFRLIDNSGSADTNTGLALTTDASGDANASVSFFKSGSASAGSFVVKNAALDDEFMTGFVVN